MKIIKTLCEYIHEELGDACKYAKGALEMRETYPEVANLFNTLSAEEMRHMQMLHAQVTKMIENYRKSVGEPPASMLAVYEYLHEQAIEKSKEVKIMQQMYNEK